ncbi:hypothetical protein ACTIVE_8316 [Actinomadura verrucosospora]|uniref:Uncharacterized protein n=2 Tax=Actinomadura verrucosospora TaxID=46165 RepID=A0A7D3ZSL8_ACTVE|nr:hypothetical protein ACTIVE_8316 [Actinomadura verrucosospora]
MRASDADRDQVADRLREALAEGRITPEEHAERIDAVYNAKTYADLDPLLADLPSEQAPRPKVRLQKDEAPLPPPVRQSSSLVAIFSGVSRKGRWLVEPTTNVSCVFGGADLDFRQAVLSQGEVTVNISCLFGGVEITVPPGVRVTNSAAMVFGGADLPDDVIDPDAPLIRLTGMVIFGGVNVRRREIGERPSRHDRQLERHRRHLEKMEEHHERMLEHHEKMHRRRDERRERLRELRAERRRHR